MTRDDDDDRQNRGVIRDVLQHAHRHVSDAISADKNNYADAAVRSYALAMDYFKTYLKMAEIEKHYGTIWRRLRRRRRRVPFFIHERKTFTTHFPPPRYSILHLARA